MAKRKSRKDSRRGRPRRSRPSRPSVPVFFLTIVVPLILVVAWFAYRFIQGEPGVGPPVQQAVEDRTASAMNVIQTPRIERALLEAGVDRDRLRWENGHLVVETFDPPEVIVHRISEAIPGSDITKEGELVVVAHAGIVEKLRVVRLQRDTESDGFVAVEAEDSVVKTEATGARAIVLILDDVGFENQPLEEVSAINAKLNFAVIPGSPRATESAQFLAAEGFEILCHLPMEPLDYPNVSPGELAIFTSMSDEQIRLTTRNNIDAIPHAKGVNNHMGSKATRDRRVMASVAEVLLEKQLYFIDSRTAGSSIAAQVAREASIPTGTRDVFLDDDPAEASVRRQLRELVKLSERRDFVIGIGHLYPATVKVLREEIPRLSEKGFKFLFASEVIR